MSNIKQIISWLLFAVVLVGTGYFIYSFVDKKTPEVKEGENRLTPDQSLIYLNTKNKTNFPPIIKNSDVDFTKIPLRVRFFILNNASNVFFKASTFEDGGTGFLVKYEYSGKLEDIYREIRTSSIRDYELIEGRMDDQAGVIILDDGIYVYKISIVEPSVGLTSVGFIAKLK